MSAYDPKRPCPRTNALSKSLVEAATILAFFGVGDEAARIHHTDTDVADVAQLAMAGLIQSADSAA
jgi:hypothetical protein